MGVIGTVLGWSAKRHVAQYDEERAEVRKGMADHAGRLAALESHVATRDDIEGVYSRLNKMADDMNGQHAKILELLLMDRR